MRLKTQANLAVGGDAIAHAPDGRVVFVEGAAPSEVVDADVVQENPSFLRARVVSVITPGLARRAPECAVFGRCGGCVLQHVDPVEQVRSKEHSLVHTLQRLAKVPPGSYRLDPSWVGSPYAYRGRARFAVSSNGVVGYRARRSRDVVDVASCPILSPRLSRALEALRYAISRSARSPTGDAPTGNGIGDEAVDEVEAVEHGGGVLVALPAALSRFADEVRLRLEPCEGNRVGDRTLTAEIADGHGALSVSPSAFAQSNTEGNAAMVTHVAALLPRSGARLSILELYSGSGNFTRVLAPCASRLFAVEADRNAILLARRVLPPNAALEEGPVEGTLGRLVGIGARFDLVFMNPPRTGMSKEAIAGVIALGATRVVYVSCDPATFARDLSRLRAGKLALDHLRMFDLYPHTAHVELIAGIAVRGVVRGNDE